MGVGACTLMGGAEVPWVRIDDGFADHPKIKHAGPLAIAAQIRALCYCARFLTNGKIPSRVVAEIFLDLKPFGARDMVLAKLWHKRSDGYLIHDYLSYQPDRKTVLQMRDNRERAGRLGGLAKAVADGLARANQDAKASGIAKRYPQPLPNPSPTTTPSKAEISSQDLAAHESKKAAARALLQRAGLTPPENDNEHPTV
jgi:hypothetical protein